MVYKPSMDEALRALDEGKEMPMPLVIAELLTWIRSLERRIEELEKKHALHD
jgi:hypothetical protein